MKRNFLLSVLLISSLIAAVALGEASVRGRHTEVGPVRSDLASTEPVPRPGDLTPLPVLMPTRAEPEPTQSETEPTQSEPDEHEVEVEDAPTRPQTDESVAQPVSEDADIVEPIPVPVEIDVEAVYEWAGAGSRCGLSPNVLHAVGNAASANGLIDGGSFDNDATSIPPIFGQTGDGTTTNLAALTDTDDGAVDLDTTWDRPVGPFQFLPASWERFGYDANQDGIADPQNLWDAAGSAANFLCEMGAGEGGAQLEAIRGYAGSEGLAVQILQLLADRPELMQPSNDARIPTGPRVTGLFADDIAQVGDLALLNESAFVELQDLHVPSPFLNQPALTPQEALQGGPVTGEVTRDAAGDSLQRIADDRFSLQGDWDGDGVETGAVVEFEEVNNSQWAVIVPTDEAGSPYGARIRIGPAADAIPLVGDWNGDGRDTIALRRLGQGQTDKIEFFDRFGLADMAPVEIGSGWAVLVVPDGVQLSTGDEAEVFEMETRDDVLVDSVQRDEHGEFDLVRVGGILVATNIAEDVEAMLNAAALDGIDLEGWGWRSHERQIELRIAHCADPFETPSHECSPPTATPGHSRHEFGLAIDFHVDGRAISASTDEFAWLTENAHRFGLFNLPSEPWHWSVDGR